MLKKFLYVTYFVCFVFLGLEVLLRVFDPIGVEYLFEAKKYFSFMQKRPQYAYIHTPGTRANLQGVDVRINSEGFRGPQFSVEKPADVYRILVYGDSVVFGWGVKEEDSLPAILPALLPANAPDGRRIEVLGAGVGSWNTRTQSEFYRARAYEYDADMLVWVIVSNDLEAKLGAHTHVPKSEIKAYIKAKSPRGGIWSPEIVRMRKSVARNSYLGAAIERFIVLHNRSEVYEDFFHADTPLGRDAQHAIKEIMPVLKKQGIAVLPFTHGQSRTEGGRDYHRLYATFFREHGIDTNEFPDEMYNIEYMNSYIDPHQNAAGVRIMGEAVAKVVKKRLSEQQL